MPAIEEAMTRWLKHDAEKHGLGEDHVRDSINRMCNYEFMQALSEAIEELNPQHNPYQPQGVTMSIEQVITENTAAIRELIAAIKANAGTAQESPAPVAKKEAEAKKPKGEQAAAAAKKEEPAHTPPTAEASAAPEQKVAPSEPQPESPSADAPTFEMCAELGRELAATPGKGREALIAIFSSVGITKLGDAKEKPELLAATHAALVAALGKGK